MPTACSAPSGQHSWSPMRRAGCWRSCTRFWVVAAGCKRLWREEEEEDELDEESLEGEDGVMGGEEGMWGVTGVSELEVVGGPSAVVLGKHQAWDEDEGRGASEDGMGSFKRPQLGKEFGLETPREVVPFSRIFSPTSSCKDKSASLFFQNVRLEAANQMFLAEVDHMAAQYCMALRRLIQDQVDAHKTQDALLQAQFKLREWERWAGGGSGRGGAFQEVKDWGVQCDLGEVREGQ
ncbi:hypothetical protein C0992_009721, partial [Termitomyces sp. T32_za158]